jgi:DHA2 family multidrug resistance protein-like MFS transporter
LISTNRLLGQTLGATVLAALLDLGHGADRIPAMLAGVLAVAACLCSLARIPQHARS